MAEREEQPEKQFPFILVIDEGISIEARAEQPEKQLVPKLVTEFGIVVSLQPVIMVLVAVSKIALQFSRESNIGLSTSTEIVEREGQYVKGGSTN